MQSRVGYPNEHLASTSPVDVSSPMYATGVGLVMKALENEDDLQTISSGQNKNKQEKAEVLESSLEGS